MIDELDVLIRLIARNRRKLLNRSLSRAGITLSQWQLLYELAQIGNRNLRQSELATSANRSSASFNQLSQHLSRRGLLRFAASSSRRSAKRMLFTAKGRELLRSMQSIEHSIERNITCKLKPGDLECAIQVLVGMRNNLVDLSGRAADTCGGDAQTFQPAALSRSN
jgi:DNA-binding MarR family transcriptional regulator